MNNSNISETPLSNSDVVKIEKAPGSGAISVKLSDVSLCYRRKAVYFLSKIKALRKEKEFWALQDISLTLYEGERVGIIGRNGSGKSTISRVISGSLLPDKGAVVIQGRVQLLALGVGFRPMMTGRENVIISGSILGLSRRLIKEKMDEIEEFAELGDFFDEPVRTYSSGMRSRLGFAVSTIVNPDILILDEVMSTGDAAFRQKANARMAEMQNKTKTVVIVSHSPAQVRELCNRAIWFEQGEILMDGTVEEVLPVYQEFCKAPIKWLQENKATLNKK